MWRLFSQLSLRTALYSLKVKMSTASNPKSDEISNMEINAEESGIGNYVTLALAIIALVTNCFICYRIHNTFNNLAPYVILKIETGLTATCQVGFVIMVLGNRWEEVSGHVLCTVASTMIMIDFFSPFVSRIFISGFRYVIDRNDNTVITHHSLLYPTYQTMPLTSRPHERHLFFNELFAHLILGPKVNSASWHIFREQMSYLDRELA